MYYGVYSLHQAYRIARSQRISLEKKMKKRHFIVKLPNELSIKSYRGEAGEAKRGF
jgi:hypothetical protein